jgi:hypothetical protein
VPFIQTDYADMDALSYINCTQLKWFRLRAYNNLNCIMENQIGFPVLRVDITPATTFFD